MKKQINLTNFTCDNCANETSNHQTFPYNEGWKYLYNFEIKLKNSKSISLDDKHFCCERCMIAYLMNIIYRRSK